MRKGSNTERKVLGRSERSQVVTDAGDSLHASVSPRRRGLSCSQVLPTTEDIFIVFKDLFFNFRHISGFHACMYVYMYVCT